LTSQDKILNIFVAFSETDDRHVDIKQVITFLISFCEVTNSRPHQLLITKVKQFGGSTSFTRRSQWTVEQLRQVNGINPNKVDSTHILLSSSLVH